MQLIWVSGPVGQIRTINITLRHVLLGVIAVLFTFILLGAFLQIIGLRLAVEYNPAIVKSLGNLHSGFELDNLNYFYRTKLGEIETKQLALHEKLKELEEKNKQLSKLVSPNFKLKEHISSTDIGGAYIPIQLNSNKSLLDSMNLMLNHLTSVTSEIEKSNQYWNGYYEKLSNLPISVPVSLVSLSSRFGERLDPITNSWSDHTGLDFQGPIGMPIYSAGKGKVLNTGWDKAYGQTVTLEHLNGYVSRYSHVSKILVEDGQIIELGQVIALVGNTGRSTGPHLHFEILQSGKHLNPADFLAGLNKLNN